MAYILILVVDPTTIRINGEGVVVILSIPGVDQEKAEIEVMSLTIDDKTFPIVDYQRTFSP